MIHIDLGSVEAILPPEEQVPGEEYTHGSRIRVYVTSVSKGMKGPSITVSRTHPALVRKLFALEEALGAFESLIYSWRRFVPAVAKDRMLFLLT